jgi:hypothetical protein
MKIQITDLDSEHSTTIPDGCTLDEVVTALKGLLVSCGFNPATVDENLNAGEWGLTDDE